MELPIMDKAPPVLPGPNNLAFVEALYEDYLREPSSVPPDWQHYFSTIVNGETSAVRLHPSLKPRSIFNPVPAEGRAAQEILTPSAALHDRVYMLVRLYRVRGHRIAKADPLGL